MYIDFSLILYIEFIFLDFRELFCSASSYNFYYFLRSRELNASPSDLADDAELSSVPKLQLKVRNGSLLKVVTPRCEAPTLIFCAVAFQHFILVLQSRSYLLSLQSRRPVLFACRFNLFRFPLLLFRGHFRHCDFAEQKIYMGYWDIMSAVSCGFAIITVCWRFRKHDGEKKR